jgi:hypothetical protein
MRQQGSYSYETNKQTYGLNILIFTFLDEGGKTEPYFSKQTQNFNCS